MTYGNFNSKINDSDRILKSIGILDCRNIKPDYNRCKKSILGELSYQDEWDCLYCDKIFDLGFYDGSFIQFIYSTKNDTFSLNYKYYCNPYDLIPSFEDYLEQEIYYSQEGVDEYDVLRRYDLITPNLKKVYTPIRYDYHIEGYKEGIHPVSHFHIGLNNNIRIATKKILNPLSFSLFIVRHIYPDFWKRILDIRELSIISRNINEILNDIPECYFKENDRHEMVLI